MNVLTGFPRAAASNSRSFWAYAVSPQRSQEVLAYAFLWGLLFCFSSLRIRSRIISHYQGWDHDRGVSV
jgi:hypothetical protein